ncbi:hypothetical protein LTR74_017948 [Friedmanniomyces endolithicus]|nr:hypothetical protein LTR74_017948 [Friedmanniomyces endolithicus]
MASEKPKILLTGATGYIGGSILSHLLACDSSALKETPITCLVRGEDRIPKLNKAYGGLVEPVIYRDLDDTEKTIEVASQHDIVVNTTLGFTLLPPLLSSKD